jgi:hypothetical protein
MGNTAQKLFSIINIESIPAWNTITVTATEHGLKSAAGTPLAPTQVIIESGLEWVASGTSVVITNRTNRDLTNTEAILTHQFSTEYDPTTVAVNVGGAAPIASLVGVTGMAQVPLDVGNTEEGEDTLVVPLIASDVSTLPVAAFTIDVGDRTILLAQGVWRVEWCYSTTTSGDDVGNVTSSLIQDPDGAAAPLFVSRASSSAYTLDAGDQTLEIGTQNRFLAGSWMVDLSAATEENRTFSLFATNSATNGTVAGLGGSMTLTKVA